MAHPHGKSPRGKMPRGATTRRFRSRGVEVQIREAKDRVELTLDGKPIDVEVIDGEYHSQLANQFTAFASVDDIVDTLLENEGRLWTLHGHVCDERCGPGGHHHDDAGDHDHMHGGER
jgi:hypothetical protein